jgi:hypothetical protein
MGSHEHREGESGGALLATRTPYENRRFLPGDDLIAHPLASLTHAITIRCAPEAVWPWLVQMGAGRAGWYSYDAIDNGGKPSAERIVPELQTVEVGYLFPWLPGASEGFIVMTCHPERCLVLGAPAVEGYPVVTWAFVLEPQTPQTTRLIVRARASRRYRFHGLPEWVTLGLMCPGHFVMQRKQLLGIARRAEARGDRARPVHFADRTIGL